MKGGGLRGGLSQVFSISMLCRGSRMKNACNFELKDLRAIASPPPRGPSHTYLPTHICLSDPLLPLPCPIAKRGLHGYTCSFCNLAKIILIFLFMCNEKTTYPLSWKYFPLTIIHSTPTQDISHNRHKK